MAKGKVPPERMLYSLFLDLYYADRGYTARIEELQEELKEAKKDAKQTKTSLASVRAQYKELYNSEPSEPKK